MPAASLALPLLLSAAVSAASNPAPATPRPAGLDAALRFHEAEAAARLRRAARFAAPATDVGYDVLRYDLAVDVGDPRVAGLDLSATAGIALRTTRPAAELALDLVGLEVRAVRVDGVEAAFRREPVVAPERLVVTLPAAVGADAELALEVEYGGTPLVGAEGVFDTGMIWDPAVALYTHHEPWFARHWFPCHDHPSDKATLRLAVTAPSDWLVAGNGLLLETTPAGPSTTTVWGTDLPIATYLVFFAAGPFTRVDGAVGALPLVHFARERDLEALARGAAELPAMFEALTARLGPYPFEKYGHVVLPLGDGGGAMENQTMTALAPVLAGADGELIRAHELAHHWFGDLVTLADWKEIWLNEGFAVFGEALWREAREGEEGYRIYVGGIEEVAILADEAAGGTAIHDPVEPFSALVYRKGARVVALLRSTLGDEAFFAGLHAYLARHRFGNASTEDLRAAMEEASGLDLERFFADWVYRGGTPTVGGVWRWGERAVEIELVQHQVMPLFELSVDVDLQLFDGTTRRERLTFDEARHTFRFCLPSPIRNVVFDPEEAGFWREAEFTSSSLPADDAACDGGEGGSGGAGGEGGSGGEGGEAGEGGTAAGGAGGVVTGDPGAGDDTGCGCRSTAGGGTLAWSLVAVALVLRRRVSGRMPDIRPPGGSHRH